MIRRADRKLVQAGRGVKPVGRLVLTGLLSLVAIVSPPRAASVQSLSTQFAGITYVDRTLTAPRLIRMRVVQDGVVTVPEYRDDSRPLGLLLAGGPASYSNVKSWYDAVNARTAIGVSRTADVLTLFTVDARGGSAGMTVREVAATLIAEFGVWNALNLDGGGSTSLAVADPATGVASLMNVSADGPDGRAVGSSLAVFAAKRER